MIMEITFLNKPLRFLWIRSKSVFLCLQILDERSQEHEKYGGNQEQPHKLHVVTRVKSTMRRPYWEKKLVEGLCLQKVGLLSAWINNLTSEG